MRSESALLTEVLSSMLSPSYFDIASIDIQRHVLPQTGPTRMLSHCICPEPLSDSFWRQCHSPNIPQANPKSPRFSDNHNPTSHSCRVLDLSKEAVLIPNGVGRSRQCLRSIHQALCLQSYVTSIAPSHQHRRR